MSFLTIAVILAIALGSAEAASAVVTKVRIVALFNDTNSMIPYPGVMGGGDILYKMDYFLNISEDGNSMLQLGDYLFSGSGIAVFVSNTSDFVENIYYRFPNNDLIVIQGDGNLMSPTHNRAIVGGTGNFRGATGEINMANGCMDPSIQFGYPGCDRVIGGVMTVHTQKKWRL